jgi:hypothetical protein
MSNHFLDSVDTSTNRVPKAKRHHWERAMGKVIAVLNEVKSDMNQEDIHQLDERFGQLLLIVRTTRSDIGRL